MKTHPSRTVSAPVTSGRPGLLTRSMSRSVIWLIAFEAALRKLAQSEPRATVRTTESVSVRLGSGLCTEPHAQTEPEMMPSSGGSRVNGRESCA